VRNSSHVTLHVARAGGAQPFSSAGLFAVRRPVRDRQKMKEIVVGKATDMVLYQAEWCPYCARVRKKLTDLLLDYKTVNVPHSHAERDEVKRVSGQTSIPVLVDGDVVLDDDDDIIPYLDKKYGASAAV
jgi:glutaredoxin